MSVLWQHGEATVEEIRDSVPHDLAPSTIRTLLNIMHDKGYVAFRMEGKAKVFRAKVEQHTAQASALATLKERLFQGSTRMLLARLVEEEDISVEDLERLRQDVQAAKDGSER
jgi:predicted transcriptional regulator